jgi:hypothetical protein
VQKRAKQDMRKAGIAVQLTVVNRSHHEKGLWRDSSTGTEHAVRDRCDSHDH